MTNQNSGGKFTAGEWGIEQTADTNWIGTLRADGKVDEIVCYTDREGLKQEALERNDANARLIASSPDLLATCELALASFEGIRPSNHYPASQREFDTLIAVISKAKGAQ